MWLDDFFKSSGDERSRPMNIVIKLHSAGGQEAVKLSDEVGKNTGSKDVIARIKQELGYVDAA